MAKFILFTHCFSGLPLALRLKEEGHKVLVAVIEPEMAEEEYFPPESREEKKKEKEFRKEMGLIGNGMIEKMWAKDVMKALRRRSKKDIYIIFDQIYGFKYGEELRELGYKVFGGTKKGYDLEINRDKAKEYFQEWEGIYIPEKREFEGDQIDEAIEFLRKQEGKLFVFKSDNPLVSVQVAEHSNEEIINKMENEREEIEKYPFLLEEKIEGYEFAVELWLNDLGEPFFFNVDFEEKRKYPECDIQVGCSYDIVFALPLDCVFFEKTFKPNLERIKEDRWQIIDMQCIYEPVNQRIYYLESCGERFGYNALYTLFETLTIPVGEFFQKVLNNEFKEDISGLFDGIGVSLRIFNDESKRGNLIEISEKVKPHFWIWGAYKKKGKLLTCEDESIGVLTAKGENPFGAFYKIKKMFKEIYCSSKWARMDFLDDVNEEGVLFRYNFFEEQGWYEKKNS